MSDLVKFDEMRANLERAQAFDEVRVIRDQAEALRTYAKAAGYGLEAQNRAAELKVRAERKAGSLLQDMGTRHGRVDTLSGLGIEHHQSSRWQRIATLPEDSFEEYVATAHAHGTELTSSGLLKLAKQTPGAALADVVVPLPTGQFSTLVADPPWQYGNKATRGAAEDHYSTMTIDALCALDVEPLLADAAHLYLWVTNGFLREGFQIVESWGFAYKTVLTWVKPQIGMGNYFRNNTEHVLFGVRGGLRTQTKNTPTAFTAKRGAHSAKPGVFYDIVEASSPGPYLEMFARSNRFGWETWGNQSLEHVEVAS